MSDRYAIPTGTRRRTNSESVKFSLVPLKTCAVNVADLANTTHSVDVTAETLYEAVAKALAALRGQPWVAEIGKGLTSATIRVRQPDVTDTVRLQDFEAWLTRPGRSPAEIPCKSRLRDILNGSKG
jgi:hypothetical protein